MSIQLALDSPSTPSTTQQFQHVLDDINMDISGDESSEEEFDCSSESNSGLEPSAIPDLYDTNRAISYDVIRLASSYCTICLAFDEEAKQVQAMVPADGPLEVDLQARIDQHIREHDGQSETIYNDTEDTTANIFTKKPERSVDQRKDSAVGEFFDFDMYDKSNFCRVNGTAAKKEPARPRKTKMRPVKK